MPKLQKQKKLTFSKSAILSFKILNKKNYVPQLAHFIQDVEK